MAELVGQEIGVSEWITVTQERIQLFADATNDHQWIHLDVERAKAGPFGTTIAHGFLTLSLLPEMAASGVRRARDANGRQLRLEQGPLSRRRCRAEAGSAAASS
jgi:acyl dehydratase